MDEKLIRNMAEIAVKNNNDDVSVDYNLNAANDARRILRDAERNVQVNSVNMNRISLKNYKASEVMNANSKCRICARSGYKLDKRCTIFTPFKNEKFWPCRCEEPVHRGCMAAIVENEPRCRTCNYVYEYYKGTTWSTYWWRNPCKTSIPLLVITATVGSVIGVIIRYRTHEVIIVCIMILMFVAFLCCYWSIYLYMVWRHRFANRPIEIVVYSYMEDDSSPIEKARRASPNDDRLAADALPHEKRFSFNSPSNICALKPFAASTPTITTISPDQFFQYPACSSGGMSLQKVISKDSNAAPDKGSTQTGSTVHTVIKKVVITPTSSTNNFGPRGTQPSVEVKNENLTKMSPSRSGQSNPSTTTVISKEPLTPISEINDVTSHPTKIIHSRSTKSRHVSVTALESRDSDIPSPKNDPMQPPLKPWSTLSKSITSMPQLSVSSSSSSRSLPNKTISPSLPKNTESSGSPSSATTPAS